MSLLLLQHVEYLRKEKEEEIKAAIGNEEEAREVITEIRSLKDKGDELMGKVVCDHLIGFLGLLRISNLYKGLSNTTINPKDIALLIGWGAVIIACVVRSIINHNKEVQYDKEVEKIENSILKKKIK